MFVCRNDLVRVVLRSTVSIDPSLYCVVPDPLLSLFLVSYGIFIPLFTCPSCSSSSSVLLLLPMILLFLLWSCNWYSMDSNAPLPQADCLSSYPSPFHQTVLVSIALCTATNLRIRTYLWKPSSELHRTGTSKSKHSIRIQGIETKQSYQVTSTP